MKRRYLTHSEVFSLIKCMNYGKHEKRNKCMVLMCYLHGFRVSELTALKLSDLDIISGTIYTHRLKQGVCTIHPLQVIELSLLKDWLEIRSQYESERGSEWLFLSRYGTRISRQYFYKMIRKYAITAGIPVMVTPHMLRHACGFSLADQGMDTRLIQDYLGHRNIRHTVHYTAANPARFSRAWCDLSFV